MFDFSKYPYDFKTHGLNVGGESMIFHCHHYNTFLQRTILDPDYINPRPILIGAAAEVAFSQLKTILPQFPEGNRKKVVEELYRLSGFGLIDLSGLSEKGGTIRTSSSHYSMGWKEKFGPSKTPVVYFTTGFLAGAWAVLYGKKLDSIQAEQTECMSTGAKQDVFVLREGPSNFASFGARTQVPSSSVGDDVQADTNVNRMGITQAITGMPILGNANGIIPAFGVYLTRMYADYYNRISFEFESLMMKTVGEQGREIGQNLLIEAGHVCAFNTFGGIMTSAEWDGLIRPSCITKEDWVSGMCSVVNGLGWGEWKVINASRNGATFRVYNDYESMGFSRMYGKSSRPINYLALGGAAGIMDLVYIGNIESKPELSEDFYRKTFKADGAFQAKVTKSAAMGHPFTEIEVGR